jgi:hypothetical protein
MFLFLWVPEISLCLSYISCPLTDPLTNSQQPPPPPLFTDTLPPTANCPVYNLSAQTYRKCVLKQLFYLYVAQTNNSYPPSVVVY